MKKILLLLCFGSMIHFMTCGQTNVVEFLKGGKADAGALSKAYLQPWANALGEGLNNGWYNTAATHKLFGFDVSASVTAVQIPASATTFDVNALGLGRMSVATGSPVTPTVAGKAESRPQVQVRDEQENVVGSFGMPDGTGVSLVPVPMAQIGIGLLPHTDFMLRYVPQLNYNQNGEVSNIGYWGVGVKHNLTEWFPGLKKLPFDVALFGALSALSGQSVLNDNSSGIPEDVISITFANDGNQQLKLETKATRFGVIVSKKIGMLTLFGGIGQSTNDLRADLVGNYTINTPAVVAGNTYVAHENMADPVSVKFRTQNLSMDAGLKLNVSVFGFFTSVSKTEYTSYNVGLSVGYR